MNKILLCLFLLTSLNFYSQVADMIHCAGDTTFNLTYHNSLLIGNLNPAETTVSYHLTAADASTGVNAISNPTNFIVPQIQGNVLASQTIYARINHLGNITTNYFSLIVNPVFLVAARIEPINCYSNGTITLDLLNGQAPFACYINGSPSANNFLYGPVSILRNPNLVAGTYNIEIIDAIGCLIRSSWNIESSSIIHLDSPTAVVTNVTCKGSNNGAININATGGKAPLQYSIDNGVNYVSSNTFTNLVPGTYNITVKDSNNCTSSMIATLVEPTPLSIATILTKTIDCASNATLAVTATGGTTPYTYSKDGITFATSNVFDNLVAGNYTVFAKDVNGCTNQSNQLILPFVPLTATIAKTEVLCKGNSNGSITVNSNGGQGPYTYSLDNGSYINGNSSMTFTNLKAGSHNITVKDINGCLSTNQVAISEPVSALTTMTLVKNQTITVNATGGTGNYNYAISPNLDKFLTNNIFSGLTPDTYIVLTKDANGCYIQMNAVVEPPAPLINGQIKLTITFKSGQTLADLIIDGQNIKWYINKSPLTGKTNKTSETPLPLSTVLVEGTTYYASQTINGIESTERVAVTVTAGSLGTTDLVIKDFTYYPNPVKNIFTISNTSVIDEVSIISIKGENLLTKKINSLNSEIDLSNFSKGVYFLKVEAEGTEKTMKLIKE
jgi:hypothetical protein